MMLFYSETKKIKYFLDPPPKKKAQGYEHSHYGYTHLCFSVPAACDLDPVSQKYLSVVLSLTCSNLLKYVVIC